jgi:hypothetical protein
MSGTTETIGPVAVMDPPARVRPPMAEHVDDLASSPAARTARPQTLEARDVASARRGRARSVPRHEFRIVGRTVATYDVSGEKRTAAYVRRLFAQRRIPDDATVEFGADRIVVEWTD